MRCKCGRVDWTNDLQLWGKWLWQKTVRQESPWTLMFVDDCHLWWERGAGGREFREVEGCTWKKRNELHRLKWTGLTWIQRVIWVQQLFSFQTSVFIKSSSETMKKTWFAFWVSSKTVLWFPLGSDCFYSFEKRNSHNEHETETNIFTTLALNVVFKAFNKMNWSPSIMWFRSHFSCFVFFKFPSFLSLDSFLFKFPISSRLCDSRLKGFSSDTCVISSYFLPTECLTAL